MTTTKDEVEELEVEENEEEEEDDTLMEFIKNSMKEVGVMEIKADNLCRVPLFI